MLRKFLYNLRISHCDGSVTAALCLMNTTEDAGLISGHGDAILMLAACEKPLFSA